MATFYKFYSFVEAVYEKKHDFSSDQFKILLTNTAPSLSWTQKSDVTGELTTGNGYTSGGTNITTTSCTQSSGLLTVIFQDVVFTGTGSGFGPFRYAVIFNETSTNDLLVGYYDYGYGISVGAQTFTVDMNQTTGFLYAS